MCVRRRRVRCSVLLLYVSNQSIIRSAAYFRCDMYKVYFVRATAYRARFICHRQFPSVELPSWRFLVKVGYLAKDDSYDVSFKKSIGYIF